MTYDFAVLGLGGMGSAALAHASERSGKVLGIEQFARGHDRGSSSGRSRVIRSAYFEDPAYVPIVLRAYDLWRELERKTHVKLLDLVGTLTVGNPETAVLRGVASAADAYDLPIEHLDAQEIARRYPGTKPRAGEIGLLERNGGIVYPEAAIEAHLRVAEANGAQTRFETEVTAFEPTREGIVLQLGEGESVTTSRLAICAGPWLPHVMRQLQLPLRVQRNVQIWFRPATDAFRIERFPTFFVVRQDWPALLYGFPDAGDGLKAALHTHGETTGADSLDRSIRDSDIAAVQALLDEWMPGAAHEFAFGKACTYTLTPDEHFIIDRHPQDPRIVMAGGFSGHGFKFAPAIGEIVTQLAFGGESKHPIAFLSLDRFPRGGG